MKERERMIGEGAQMQVGEIKLKERKVEGR